MGQRLDFLRKRKIVCGRGELVADVVEVSECEPLPVKVLLQPALPRADELRAGTGRDETPDVRARANATPIPYV